MMMSKDIRSPSSDIDQNHSRLGHFGLGHARRLRVDTLVRLRWLAICGQSAAILCVHDGLNFAIPLMPCFGVITTSVILNLVLRLIYPVTKRLENWPAFLILVFDSLQLSGLLFLTGGLENPFSLLFLAPVIVSATSLPFLFTASLQALIIALSTGLVFYHLPLPWIAGQHLHIPFFYLFGIWTALVLGTLFIGLYAAWVAREARTLADALTATELVLLRAQHLSQLDGLAAACAHELGTPLATIALVVKEMLLQLEQHRTSKVADHSENQHSLMDDVSLLHQEVQRCKAILAKLASLGHDQNALFEVLTLDHIIEDCIAPLRGCDIAIQVSHEGEGAPPQMKRNPGILYGIGNLIENALEFARHTVFIKTSWTRTNVTISISDDGPGFAPSILPHLGEPYVTYREAPYSKGNGIKRQFFAVTDKGIENTSDDLREIEHQRLNGQSQENQRQNDQNYNAAKSDWGLGLGLFIAKTLLERSGASLRFHNANASNAQTNQTGAVVTITWPRAVFN